MSTTTMHSIYLIAPGPRPFFGDVADHLWGPGRDIDSDGNANEALPDGWTELTVILRPDREQRVDIDPLDDREPLVLAIRSEHEALAREAANFLQSVTGGVLTLDAPQDRGGGR
jgi:hypothetical protein